MASAAATVDDALIEELDESWPRPFFMTAIPGWLVSMTIHAVAVLILALLTIAPREIPRATVLEGVIEAADETELFHPTTFQPAELKNETLVSSVSVADLTSTTVSDGGQLGGISASLSSSG